MPDPAPPSALWKQLPPERKQQAAEAFWRDDNAAAEQAEVVATLAHRLKFRPKSVLALPLEKKVRYLTSLPQLSEAIAARLLVAYHLAHQRPMMGTFLEALGIAHDNGLIADEDVKAPPADRLKAAVDAIAAAYPAADVHVYLSTLMWQDPDTWGALANIVQPVARA